MGVGWASVAAWAAMVPAKKPLPKVESTEQWCRELSHVLKSVNFDRCRARSWKVEAHSKSNLPIPQTYWGADTGRHVMIIGGIHGDEISSVSLVFRWMDFLDSVRDDSPLRKMRFVFLPLVNPDGFWSFPRTRVNIAGVDLNRNFNTKGWEKEALSYWRNRTHQDKRRFPGNTAASEVETQFLQTFIDGFKPEIIASVHAPYGILDHDGPVKLPKNLHSPLPVKTLGAFPGSLGRYVGIDRNIPVITVELTTDKTLPDSKAIEELFVYVLNSQGQGEQAIAR